MYIVYIYYIYIYIYIYINIYIHIYICGLNDLYTLYVCDDTVCMSVKCCLENMRSCMSVL